jgi:hypothetical protein
LFKLKFKESRLNFREKKLVLNSEASAALYTLKTATDTLRVESYTNTNNYYYYLI